MSYDHDDDTPTKAAPVDVKHVGGPLPVHGRRPRSITSESIPCDVQGQAVRVLPNNPERCRAQLRADTGDVHLGGPGVTPGTGYKLDGTNLVPIEVKATEALYAIPDPAAPVGTTVYVLAEHYDG